MAITLTISGDDPTKFYSEAMNALLLLAQGGNTLFKPQTAQSQTHDGQPVDNGPANPPQAPEGGEPLANPSVAAGPVDPPAPKARRGRPPKAAPIIEATAQPASTSKAEPNDGIPDFLDRRSEKTDDESDPLGLDDKPAQPEKKQLTLDDMRDRVKAIVESHQKRGHNMPECVAYVRKLFAGYNIKLAAELKPEQFDKFWEESEAYLKGTAK